MHIVKVKEPKMKNNLKNTAVIAANQLNVHAIVNLKRLIVVL